MDLILSFSAALFLSIVLIPMLMRVSVRLQLVDIPTEERKRHTASIPCSGGLGIVLGVFFSINLWLKPEDYLWPLFLSGAIIVLFGFLDDRFGLHYRWKFFGQILAVVVLLTGGVVIDSVPFMGLDSAPAWLSYPLTFLFVLGAINAVNLSDGLDGLAAGITLLSLGLIAVFGLQINNHSIVLVALAVMGGLLGFLRYNTFPAQIFMGDAGSQFLGLITASLAILVTQDEYSALSSALPLLILGLPIIDTLMVMAIRHAQSRSLFLPDNTHIHYQFTQIGFKHNEAVAMLYLLQAVLVCMAWQFRFATDFTVLFAYSLFCFIVVGGIGLARVSGWRLHKQPPLVAFKDRRNPWFRKLHWLHCNSSRLLEVGMATFLFATAFFVKRPVLDVSWWSLGAAAICALVWLCFRQSSAMVTRIVFYVASILLMYALLVDADNRPILNILLDAYLFAMMLFLILAIRLTRKELFRLDTEDYLVLFIICVVPFLPFGDISDFSIGQITLRLAVLLYSCEYLLGKDPVNNVLLKGASIASMVLLSVPS